MKIIGYELLGLVKDHKTPKKIKYDGRIYNYEDDYDYFASDYGYLFDRYSTVKFLNEEIEIVEEKKIPEKIDMFDYFTGYDFSGTDEELLKHLETNFEIINKSINEIIECLESEVNNNERIN